MNKSKDLIEQDIEKFRFELAEELGIVEQPDRGRRGRNVIERYRPPQHRHLKDKQERP